MCLAACLLSGCATIISGTTAEVHISGNVSEPVNIATSHADYHDVTLPATVRVKRRNLDGQHIHISSASHAFSDIVLKSKTNPWSIVSALGTGMLFVVDLVTNAVNEPAQNSFFITPAAPLSQADSLHRADSLRLAASTAATRKARQLPLRRRKHELRGGVGFGSCQASHDRDKLCDRYVRQYNLTAIGECFDLFGNAFLQAGLEYHYGLSRRWELGVLANWGLSRESYDTYSYGPDNAALQDYHPDTDGFGDEFCRFFVVAPSVRYTWLEADSWRCYSRVALGAMRHHQKFVYNEYPRAERYHSNNEAATPPASSFTDITDKTLWRMAYQLTAIGLSIRTSSSSLWCELGYGSLGIVRFGVGFLF